MTSHNIRLRKSMHTPYLGQENFCQISPRYRFETTEP